MRRISDNGKDIMKKKKEEGKGLYSDDPNTRGETVCRQRPGGSFYRVSGEIKIIEISKPASQEPRLE